MNKQRRTAITQAVEVLGAAANQLENLQLQVGDAREAIDAAKDEEQDYKDNMPENLQSSAKGEQADAAIASLEEATSDLDALLGQFSDIADSIGTLADALNAAVDTAEQATN